ncbi:MAG: hypothetical protein CL885_04585 [Dehalococcoidia bacterium]|nr:hypothetical protein [Dehalococcoidia bacterium]
MNANFKIGDLIGIKSSADNKLIETIPPGIIIKIQGGYPITPVDKFREEPRVIATILWDSGVEEKVDVEWLVKLAEL